MKKQQGLSLIGVLIVGALLVFVLLVGFRSVPAITEYMAVERALKALAEEGDKGATAAEVRRNFGRRAEVEDISSVTSADLEISKPAGKTLIEVSYSRKVPLAGNVSLLFDFTASSADTP